MRSSWNRVERRAEPQERADAGIHYRSLFPASATGTTAHALDSSLDTTLPLLRDYFLLDSARLSDLYAEFSERDARFKKVVESDGVGERVRGLRVCKQDEWEALVAYVLTSPTIGGR